MLAGVADRTRRLDLPIAILVFGGLIPEDAEGEA